MYYEWSCLLPRMGLMASTAGELLRSFSMLIADPLIRSGWSLGVKSSFGPWCSETYLGRPEFVNWTRINRTEYIEWAGCARMDCPACCSTVGCFCPSAAGGVPNSVQCGACWISPLCRTVRRIWRFLVVVCPKGGAKFDRGVVCTGFPFVI